MDKDLYIGKIVTSILKTQNDIKGVKNFEFLKMFDYTKRNHEKIGDLIRAGNVAIIEQLSDAEMDLNKGYDLMVVKFTDSQDNRFMAIIYDSDELWQDPKALDIFPV